MSRVLRFQYLTFALVVCLGLMPLPGCSEDAGEIASQSTPEDAKPARRGYETSIPMIEFWDGTNQVKYEYEMRYGPDKQLQRNGWSRAYYSNGRLEREGAYLNGERAGLWTHYTVDGEVQRTKAHGGEAIWTAPGQSYPVPGTEQ